MKTNRFDYHNIKYNDMDVSIIIPPDEIEYIGDKSIYVPVAFRPAKKGEMIWHLKCSFDSELGRDILARSICDGYEPKWIYKKKEEVCS